MQPPRAGVVAEVCVSAERCENNAPENTEADDLRLALDEHPEPRVDVLVVSWLAVSAEGKQREGEGEKVTERRVPPTMPNWSNTLTRVASWTDHSADNQRQAEPDADAALPSDVGDSSEISEDLPLWEESWSEEYNQRYWTNRLTRRATWTDRSIEI